MRRRRRRFGGGGNIPYNLNVYNNPYRRGGGVRRHAQGGRIQCPPGTQWNGSFCGPYPTGGGTSRRRQLHSGAWIRPHSHQGGFRRMSYGNHLMSSCPGQHACPDGTCPPCNGNGASDSWLARRGGPMRRQYQGGGGIHLGSPNSCKDGYGYNIPC